ncbi:glutaredoxin family protein [Thioalkalivibrio nitratireducens]|nr:thioredoxin family protein [Thioalkalivibrio nitratireducens]
MRRVERVLVLLAALLSLLGLPATAAADSPETGARMYVFWSETCPHCINQKPFLRELEQRYPELTVDEREISRTREHHRLFIGLALAHGIDPGSVPTIFLGGKAWIGDGPDIRREIEATVQSEIAQVATEAQRAPEAAAIEAIPEQRPVSAVPPAARNLDIPLLGSVNLSVQPVVLTTALIALIDGLNPCSLWVLALLLGLVIHSGSRGRIALVGITFLTTTALIYGAFIAGVFSVLNYVLYLTWVQWLVAAFALTFGLVNIKDYFWFRTGPSFTIAESHKPGIYKGIRGLMDRRLTGLSLLVATIVMAAGIALVELPCTAGFPVVWSGIVADQNIAGLAFLLLLGIYLLIYLLIELVVFVAALVTLRMGRFEESHGRVLKLVGGLIMVALALVLALNPELMNDVGGTLLVFAGSLLLAGMIILAHRRFAAA